MKRKIRLNGVRRCKIQRESSRSIQLKKYWIKKGRRCDYCNDVLTVDNITVDHVIPLSKNGTSDTENLVPCCISCNRLKSNKSKEEFESEIKKRS